jgi:hypothetical protein
MRAFVYPRVARAAWLVLLLAPALALAAPKGKPPAKKPPAKKPPAGKTVPADEPATQAPDDGPGKEPGKDTRTPPAAGAGAGGSAGGATGADGASSADKSGEPAGEPAAEKPSGEVDVDTLRQEYLSLRDELFRSRARANAVASQLYSTRIQIRLTYASGRYYSPIKSSIRLDGAAVYEDAKGSIAADDGIRFDGYVAPGRHLITFRVEAVGKDDDSFASVTESQITVKAVADKDLVVAAKAKDGGDIAYEWKKKEKGNYGLGIDVAVKTQPRSAGGDKAAPAAKGAK